MNRDLRRDLYATAAAALLVVVAAVVGTGIEHRDRSLYVPWPPLLAKWDPHVGPGTPAAIAVAVAVVVYGPALAARLPWRPLLLAAWGAGMAWTWSLALVDGWYRGVAQRLTTSNEYLQVIGRFHDIPHALRDFTHHILSGPNEWPAHIAGHPAGATVTFVLLDRIGLGGGGWAGAFVITVGTSAAAAVLVAVRALADERLARRAAPFLVLMPGAVWVGASADGYFTGVAAWAVAFLALAVTGRRPRATGFAAGLLFGLTAYLSYGLTLFALLAAAVLLLGPVPGFPSAPRRPARHLAARPNHPSTSSTRTIRPHAEAPHPPQGPPSGRTTGNPEQALGPRRVRPLPFLLAGLAVVPAVFTALGFNWWEAYHLLVTRYYQGVGGVRPYSYWVWANLACTVFIVGPATATGLRRTGTTLVRRDSTPALRLTVLTTAALLAILVADVSGMSKAETERIWLPFALWLLPACAFLTRPRVWLTAQAVLALLVNHLLWTWW